MLSTVNQQTQQFDIQATLAPVPRGSFSTDIVIRIPNCK